MMKAKDTFAQRITELRKNSCLTQQEVADAIGITRQTLGRYESGERTADIETLTKIADFFDVTSDWLTGHKRTIGVSNDNTIGAKETFATRVYILRKNRNISLVQLASVIGVTAQSLSYYENCTRTINIDLLVKIARYFNVSADYLLGLSDAPCADTSGCEQYITYEENKLSKQREEIADALEKLASSIRE